MEHISSTCFRGSSNYCSRLLLNIITWRTIKEIREPIMSFTGHKALLALLVSSKNSRNRQTKHFEDILWCFWKCKMQNSRVFDDTYRPMRLDT